MIVLEVGKELDQVHVGDGRVQPSNKIKVRNIQKYFLSQPDLLSHLLLLVALEEERLGHDLSSRHLGELVREEARRGEEWARRVGEEEAKT